MTLFLVVAILAATATIGLFGISAAVTEPTGHRDKRKPPKPPIKPIALAFLIVCALAAATAALPSIGFAATCGGYEIRSGDTLTRISRDTGHTLDELVAANGLLDPNKIRAGDCLNLPNQDRFDTTYTPADHKADGPQPGAAALATWIDSTEPTLGTAVDPQWGIGIYNPRKARGSSQWSTHAEGRGIDVYIPDCETGGPAWDLMWQLGYHAAELGIQRIVMCDLEWRNHDWFHVSDTLASYHDGRLAPAHLHIELSRDGAANLTGDHIKAALG